MESGDPTLIEQSLLQAALYDADWHWVQNRCLDLLQHPDLQALQHEPSLVGRIEDALDDIHMFTRDRMNVSPSVNPAERAS